MNSCSQQTCQCWCLWWWGWWWWWWVLVGCWWWLRWVLTMTSSLREREWVFGPELIISATDDASNASDASHLIYSSSSPFASDVASSSCALQDIRYGPWVPHPVRFWVGSIWCPQGGWRMSRRLYLCQPQCTLSLSLLPLQFSLFFSYTFLPGFFLTSLSFPLCARPFVCYLFQFAALATSSLFFLLVLPASYSRFVVKF